MHPFDPIIRLNECLKSYGLSETNVEIVPNKTDEVVIKFLDENPVTTTSITNVCRILFYNHGINRLTLKLEPLSVNELSKVEYTLQKLHRLLCIKGQEKRFEHLAQFIKDIKNQKQEKVNNENQTKNQIKTVFDASDAALYAILTSFSSAQTEKAGISTKATLNDISVPREVRDEQKKTDGKQSGSNFITLFEKTKQHIMQNNFPKKLYDVFFSTAETQTNITSSSTSTSTNFIRQIIEEDLASKKHSEIVTRFPPEPNGRLHLGHAKSICLNFGIAKEFNGRCHLRFDDTNPEKEEQQFIESIQEDVKWLGGDWKGHLYYASDYFETLFNWAVELIKQGYAYVDDQTEEQVRINRGDLLHPGKNSIYRDRSIEENLDLFYRMKNGEFPEGSRILRAKIDMTHGNMNMRDPPIYRIKLEPHPRTKSAWKVYPFYDFAHGQSDSIEKITHSICTLEFEDHRPLYEWFQEKLSIHRTRQIEFARLNCTHVVTSKRKLMTLVERKFVDGWDDPRLPTLSGLRRRGVPPEAIQDFCGRIGVAKRDIVVKYELLESCIIQALNPIALRRNVILKPLLVHITNLKYDETISLSVPNHPEDKTLGFRQMTFCNKLYIDEEDFAINPLPGYTRLTMGGEVRLHYGFWIKCYKYNKDNKSGKVSEVFCTYEPETKNGSDAIKQKRKNSSVIHWVSSFDAIDFTVSMFEHLFKNPTPNEVVCTNEPSQDQWENNLNPNSLKKYKVKGEACLQTLKHPYIDNQNGKYLQFERIGFFVPDYSSKPENPIFNLTVLLNDTWASKTNQASIAAQRKEKERIAREKAVAAREEKKKKRLERNTEK